MKNVFKILTLFFVSSVVLSGCDTKSNNKKDYESKDISFLLPSYTFSDNDNYEITISYSDGYFVKPSDQYSSGLMMLSFVSAYAPTYEEKEEEFFNDMRFNNILYVENNTEESVSYGFAHKTIDDFELICLNVRGYDYGLEWINNFEVGESGNHKGFDHAADIVYDNLSNYLDNYKNKTIKLWMSGNSRGGAVCELLYQKIATRKNLNIDVDNIYTYTFEAPRGIALENKVEAKNIFNMINSCDIVTYVCPEEFGLYRIGRDIDVYDKAYATLLNDFDKNITLPAFVENDSYKTLKEYVPGLIKEIVTPKEDKTYSIENRQGYYKNQELFKYLIRIIRSEPTLLKVIQKKASSLSLFELLGLISDEGQSLYAFLSSCYEEAGVAYDETYLQNICKMAVGFVKTYQEILLREYLSKNVLLSINMHFPETEYVLLKHHQFMPL